MKLCHIVWKPINDLVLAKSDIFSDFRSVRFDCFLERFDPQIEI